MGGKPTSQASECAATRYEEAGTRDKKSSIDHTAGAAMAGPSMPQPLLAALLLLGLLLLVHVPYAGMIFGSVGYACIRFFAFFFG